MVKTLYINFGNTVCTLVVVYRVYKTVFLIIAVYLPSSSVKLESLFLQITAIFRYYDGMLTIDEVNHELWYCWLIPSVLSFCVSLVMFLDQCQRGNKMTFWKAKSMAIAFFDLPQSASWFIGSAI